MIQVDERIINSIVSEHLAIDWSELTGLGIVIGLVGLLTFFVLKLQYK